MYNPYRDVKWDNVMRISSASHVHLTTQEALNNGYRHGLRHFPLSNYYPSASYSADTRFSDFTLRQSWATKCKDVPVEPPVNWNDLITWKEELKEPYRSSLPFAETETVFFDLPHDVILSNNAEHHSFTNANCHVNSLGSSFASGNFDVYGRYRLKEHGYPVGFGGSWRDAFRGILDALDYPDGGGITIDHPTWASRLSDDEVFEMLDFDERVLGIEIYNDLSANRNYGDGAYKAAENETEPGFSLNMWDRILATGRRCWGFCVPDHSVEKGGDWQGRCVLLVSAFTEHECLKAYREGRFYGCLKDNGLAVTNFEAADASVSVAINSSVRIKFITNEGQAESTEGRQAVYDIPLKEGMPRIAYVRVEIEDDTGERVFLQPVIYGRNC